MQYLILHKVRGEPAFDIAEKAMFGDEEGWILCTCGHRAYPYWHLRLDALFLGGEIAMRPDIVEMPPDWPEHYNALPEPKKVEVNMSAFHSSISKFKRRI
jgi:hypothetical protein